MAELLGALADGLGVAAVIVTAIDRDGTLAGPDLDGLGRGARRRRRSPVIASGGVGSVADLAALARLRAPADGPAALAGAVVGHRRLGGRSDDRGGGGGGVRTVRVIPCLDVDGGRVVKGVRFVDLFDAGDPVELAARYDAQGADELVFLDITASSDDRDTMVEVVARTAEQVFIPFTVGGGVRSVEDARRLLRAGADKVGVNTAAVERPELVAELADGVRGPVRGGGHRRPSARPDRAGTGGRCSPTADARPTGLDALAWAERCADLGAGEILLTSMDRDGTRDGFDLDLTRAVAARCACRSSPRAGSGPSTIWSRGRSRAGPTPCWPPRSSIVGEFTVAEAKAYLARRGRGGAPGRTG